MCRSWSRKRSKNRWPYIYWW